MTRVKKSGWSLVERQSFFATPTLPPPHCENLHSKRELLSAVICVTAESRIPKGGERVSRCVAEWNKRVR